MQSKIQTHNLAITDLPSHPKELQNLENLSKNKCLYITVDSTQHRWKGEQLLQEGNFQRREAREPKKETP